MPSSNRASLLVLAGLAVCTVLISVLVVTTTISLDDPFIGLRYANNMVQGQGLVYNPGEYVEGYTAYFWIIVAALGMALGFEPLGFWQVGLLAANLVTLWMVWLLGQREGRSPLRALLAPALLATHLGFVSWPMTGMETSFFVMLVTVAVVILDRQIHRTVQGSAFLGFILFMLCLTRFDGFILVGILGMHELWTQRSLRRSIPAIAVFLVGMVSYNVWRLVYYGDPLPNTFYAKSRTLENQLSAGYVYLRHFATWGGPYLLLVLALPAVARRATATMKLALWVAAVHLAYVGAVGGDWMKYYRFIVPVLPLLCLLMQESVWAAHDMARDKGGAGSFHTAALPIGVALLLVVNIVPLLRSDHVTRPAPGPYWSAVDAKRIGESLDAALPPDCLVAVEWAGIIPFYLRQPVLDIFGLSDKEIIEGEFEETAMGRGITPEYLAQRGPVILVYCARIFDTREEAEIGIDCRVPLGTRIHAFYRAVEALPEYENCIMEMDGGYWPFLVRSDSPLRDKLCSK